MIIFFVGPGMATLRAAPLHPLGPEASKRLWLSFWRGVGEEEVGNTWKDVLEVNDSWRGCGQGVVPFIELIPYNSASLSKWVSMPSASAYVF